MCAAGISLPMLAYSDLLVFMALTGGYGQMMALKLGVLALEILASFHPTMNSAGLVSPSVALVLYEI